LNPIVKHERNADRLIGDKTNDQASLHGLGPSGRSSRLSRCW
jgi:hypothetical protein